MSDARARLTRSLGLVGRVAQQNEAQRTRLQQGAAAMADHATAFVDATHAATNDADGDAITRALRGRARARQLATRE